MRKLLLLGMVVGILSACGESDSSESDTTSISDVKVESPSSVKVLEPVFNEAQTASMDSLDNTYKKYFSKWLSKNKLNKETYNADRQRDVFDFKNKCVVDNRFFLDLIVPIMREYVKEKKNPTYEEIMQGMHKGYFEGFVSRPNKTSKTTTTAYVSDSDITKWMSKYDGSVFEFEYDVKKMLDDPKSFEHVETSGSSKNGAKLQMKFRAKNKFGATVLNTAYADLNTIDGTVSNIRIE